MGSSLSQERYGYTRTFLDKMDDISMRICKHAHFCALCMTRSARRLNMKFRMDFAARMFVPYNQKYAQLIFHRMYLNTYFKRCFFQL
jgi:hypothetical protein